jgi:hypothetical protein
MEDAAVRQAGAQSIEVEIDSDSSMAACRKHCSSFCTRLLCTAYQELHNKTGKSAEVRDRWGRKKTEQ